MGYQVILERTPNNYSAYSRDYPGIGVTGDSEQRVRELLAEAVEIYEEEERKERAERRQTVKSEVPR